MLWWQVAQTEERDLVLSATVLRILRGLVQGAQILQHVGQRVEVPAMLDLVGDELGSSDPADGPRR